VDSVAVAVAGSFPIRVKEWAIGCD